MTTETATFPTLTEAVTVGGHAVRIDFIDGGIIYGWIEIEMPGSLPKFFNSYWFLDSRENVNSSKIQFNIIL